MTPIDVTNRINGEPCIFLIWRDIFKTITIGISLSPIATHVTLCKELEAYAFV
jgi:hypothetical protein